MKSKNPKNDSENCAQSDFFGGISYNEYKSKNKSSVFKVIVKNLPDGITESGIKHLFLKIGKPLVLNYVPKNSTVFAEFRTWKEAELAVRDLNNTPPYYLKVYIKNLTNHPKEDNSQKSTSDFTPIDYKSEQASSTEYSQKDNETHFKTNDTFNDEIQKILKVFNYDPSVRMRQKKLDLKNQLHCVSFGRGYFRGAEKDHYVGGLQTFSCASENSKLKIKEDHFCENCKSLTTRICGECSSPYCSEECLEENESKHSCTCTNNKFEKTTNDSNDYSDSDNDDNNDSTTKKPKGELSNADYEIESGCTVVVSMYCTLRTVFITRVDGKWEEIFLKLCNEVAIAGLKEEKLKTAPKVGDLCIAIYYEDGRFYRARVCSVEGDRINVSFVDYGNTQLTNLEDLKPLPDNLKKLKEFAVKVDLKDVPKGSSVASVNYFNSLTAEKIPLLVKFEDLSEGVVLVEKESNEVVNEKVTRFSLPSWKIDESALSKLGEVFFMESISLQNLEVGKQYDLCLSHFDEKEFLESGVLWATDKTADDYIHLKTEMKERMLQYCALLKDDFYLPRVNELCIAYDKGEWHRCVNLNTQNKSSYLFFVDDGHSSMVTTANIRKIVEEFVETPAQAVCCVLSDDLQLKTNEQLKSKVINYLKANVGQTIVSVYIEEFLGDVYCVSMPEIKAMLT